MRMNKYLLRISICLWLCLFTFISTWGDDEVSFNPVTITSENAYFELTNNGMENVTGSNPGIKGAFPKILLSLLRKEKLVRRDLTNCLPPPCKA